MISIRSMMLFQPIFNFFFPTSSIPKCEEDDFTFEDSMSEVSSTSELSNVSEISMFSESEISEISEISFSSVSECSEVSNSYEIQDWCSDMEYAQYTNPFCVPGEPTCLDILEQFQEKLQDLVFSGMFVLAKKESSTSPTTLQVGTTVRFYHRMLYSYLSIPHSVFPVCFVRESNTERFSEFYKTMFRSGNECENFAKSIINLYSKNASPSNTQKLPHFHPEESSYMLYPLHQSIQKVGLMYWCLWKTSEDSYALTVEESPFLSALHSKDILMACYVAHQSHTIEYYQDSIRSFRSTWGSFSQSLPYCVVLYNFFAIGLLYEDDSLTRYVKNM